jgi:hypothetical protein
MYGSFWRRFRVPESDPVFDEEVQRIIGSMNNVGLNNIGSLSSFDQFLISTLTTEGRRTGFRRFSGLGLVLGGIVGLSLWPLATNEPYNPEVENMVKHTLNTYGHYIIGSATPVALIAMVHPVQPSLLAILRNNAQSSDSFLRQYNV